MFVHIIMATNTSELRECLEDIRHEISLKQMIDASQGNDQKRLFLGDLGHHCESLLEHHEQAKNDPHDTRSVPEFKLTQSDDQSWLDYLEDGFEIPYWKMMLDAFSTSRLNKPTLSGKVVSRALISMRADILNSRSKLQTVLDAMPGDENVEGIISVVDKRIKILRSFTDRVVFDRRTDADVLMLISADARGKPDAAGTATPGLKEAEQVREYIRICQIKSG